MNDKKICRDCGRELLTSNFRISKGGVRCAVCNDCARAKRRARKLPPLSAENYSDPDFDGQTIGDVFRLMGRAKRWLESRGCTIRLEGEYTETKTHKMKY